MSANLVSKTLIDLLLTAAIHWQDAEPFTYYWVRAGTQPVTTDTADRVGEMLRRANWDHTEGWALPEERSIPELPAYAFDRLTGPLEPVVVLRQISYYTYQTADDELERWLLSEPQAFLDALTRAAHQQLPGTSPSAGLTIPTTSRSGSYKGCFKPLTDAAQLVTSGSERSTLPPIAPPAGRAATGQRRSSCSSGPRHA